MATVQLEICDKCGHQQDHNAEPRRKMYTIGAVWEEGAHSSVASHYTSYGPRQSSKSINLCQDCMVEVKLVENEKLKEPPKEETPAETLLRVVSEVARCEAENVIEDHRSSLHQS